MAKDYYSVLGVSKNATPEEIKKAYRNLAREHHPDMVKDVDKASAEKKFKEINEAYQVLGDPQKKQMYDQYGHTGGPNAGPRSQGFGGNAGNWGPFSYSYSSGGQNPFDIFESFFGGRNPRRGKNLSYEMQIEFTDAVFGLEKTLSVESGKITIKIPAGVRDGTEIKFPQKGMPGPHGIPNGDLYITVRYKSPKEFNVMGENIVIASEISFFSAILGGVMDVPVVDTSHKSGLGTTKLKIPAGTTHGTQFLLRGKGMPRLNREGFGDAIVQVFINIPKKLSKKQRELLEQYQALS